MSRPREHDREAAAEAFKAYIQATPIPIAAEFAVSIGISKTLLYEWGDADPKFLNLIKQCTTKKEAALEREGLEGRVDKTMAIFSLKQLGWSDRVESTHKGDPAAPIVISNTVAKW